MTKKPPKIRKPLNFPRLRALHALRTISTPLTSDILADGGVGKKFDLPVSRPVQLGNVVLSQSVMFDAFRKALKGETVSKITDQDDKTLDTEVTTDPDGSAIIKIHGKGYRFENAALLWPEVEKREEFLRVVFGRNSFAAPIEEQLRKNVLKNDFSDEDFLSMIELISTSQESFLGSLAPKIRARQITLGDVLPEQISYWDQLAAPIQAAQTLDEFQASELLQQRQRLLTHDAPQAIRALALTFCAPPLVPHSLFDDLSADAVLTMVEEVSTFTDHFSLIGAFEICGNRLASDSRFGPVGEKILERLFANADKLKDACWLYGAGFVLATARLRQQEELRKRPAFWRRLTAAAHASFFARAFGSSNIDPEALFKWAMRVSGKAYYCAICLDAVDEPRWRPDWLTPNMLIPDAFGRADAVLARLPEGVANSAWVERIEAFRKIVGSTGAILSRYPAIGESAPRKQPSLADLGELAGLYQSLIDDPTVDNFLMVGPVVFCFGVPEECRSATASLLASLRQSPAKFDDVKMQGVVAQAVYVAVQLRDRSLADGLAEFLLENARSIGDATETIFRLIECYAADADRLNAFRVLARRLESLSLLAPSGHLADVLDSLRILQKLDPELALLLGKALAAARMGTKAA